MTDAECRAYLLGRMPADAAGRLEERVLDDDEVYQQMVSAEDDLFDAFARGRLTPDERDEFVKRFGHVRERVAFAQALTRRVGAADGGSRPWAWIPLAAAAALAVAAGGWWLYSQPARVVPVVATQTPGAVTVPPVVALLTLGTSRAAAEPPAIRIPAGTRDVQLRVRLDPADRFDRYDMELRSAGNRVVWRGQDLTAAAQNGDLVVSATVPAALLADGLYELSVRGGSSDLGFLPVRITRIP